MPIPTAKLAQKRAKLRAKREGTTVTLFWREWPNGKPAADPTTGATLSEDDKQPALRSLTVKAFVHIVAGITSSFRRFPEIQSGDAIVDFPLALLRITDAGDTDLQSGAVVTELVFSAANREIAGNQTPADGETVAPHELDGVSLEFGGHRWAQKEVGEELANNWDALYADLNLTRALLVCKV